MAKKIAGPQALTANRLQDGIVVFLGAGGAWTPSIERALVAHSAEDISRLESQGGRAAEANIIVDPYLIEVEKTGSSPVPAAFRERMRARGPDVTLEFQFPNQQTRNRRSVARRLRATSHVQI